MRIDKFLQATGLIKRRVLANEACKRHLVKVNGTPAKPTREIGAGDLIELDLPHRDLAVKVLKDLERPTLRKADRPAYLEILRDVARTPDDDFWKDDE